MKAFLSCTAAGLQGAWIGPVYLCYNVIRGSNDTWPSLCTFLLYILSSIPINLASLLLPFTFQCPYFFFFPTLSFIIIQIFLLTPADLRTCLMWSWHDETWRKVESLLLKGKISMITVLEINSPCLYLRDWGIWCVWDIRRLKSSCIINEDARWCCWTRVHLLQFQSSRNIMFCHNMLII